MEKAIEVLKSGGVLLYPTDTIWGLGCDATNEAACQKILDLKQRPANKSFIILVDSWRMLEQYVPEFHEICYDLVDVATRPLTIIYPGAKGLAPSVLAEDGSVGIRITHDPLCLQLIRSLRKPLVSTSANLSEQATPKRYADIDPVIKAGVDHIIEQKLHDKMDTPSQIIKIGLGGEVKVIRG